MITYPNIKINLGLRILRKRPDGYHDLETLFVPDDTFKDTLEIVTGDDWSRTSKRLFGLYGSEGAGTQVEATVGQQMPGGYVNSVQDNALADEADICPALRQAIAEDGKVMITIARAEGVHWDPADDLTVKAYHILDQEFGLPPVKIFLEKNIPVGAGLGGGSADGAFALRMLNEMFGLGLSDDALANRAARLGSDCAFFIFNKPMIGQGRGEILSPWDFDMGEYELKVVVPEGVSVSTREAYAGVHPRERKVALTEALARPLEEWKNYVENDFEASVFALHPELGMVKDSLYQAGAVYASMSGSGSALFGIFRKP